MNGVVGRQSVANLGSIGFHRVMVFRSCRRRIDFNHGLLAICASVARISLAGFRNAPCWEGCWDGE